MGRKLILGLALATMLSGTSQLACTPLPATKKVSALPMPPIFRNWRVIKSLVPRSQKFKIAVLTFIDQTAGKAKIVEDPVADMLTTELFRVGRFELYDRRDLGESSVVRMVGNRRPGTTSTTGSQVFTTRRRDKTSTQYERVRNKVDGILLGYITSFNEKRDGMRYTGEFAIDFRIVNAWLTSEKLQKDLDMSELSELVIYGASGNIKFHTSDLMRRTVIVDRDDAAKVAKLVKEEFKDFSNFTAKVTGIDNYVITLNKGAKDHIKQGFTGYVVKKDLRTGVYRYLAEFAVINVFDSACTAVVVGKDGRDAMDYVHNVEVGSTAIFK